MVQKNDRSEKTTATESQKVVQNLNRSEKSTAMECDEVAQNLNRLNISTATESQKVVQKNDRCEITTTTESKNGPLEVQKMDPINTDFTNTESKRDIYSSSPSSCSEDGRTKRDVLIVGHGAMDSSIVCHVKRRQLEDFWKEGIKNCKLIQLI